MSTVSRIINLPFKLLPKLIKLNYFAFKQYFSRKRQIIDISEASYIGDHFATVHHVAFLHDDKFKKAYNEAFSLVEPKVYRRIRSLDISWRAHIVTWAAQQAITLDGDFVECGVWWGFLSKTICEYIDFEKHTNKTFYLIDTWGDPKTEDINHKNYQNDVYEKVKQRFMKYPNVQLVRGFVPNILDSIPTKKIAYLSIDMNGYIAERHTLEKYYDDMVPGGIIYFDDYGWDYPKLRETIEDFFKDKPETLLHFPSGNSIVVKL